jgi:hypothetical protein
VKNVDYNTTIKTVLLCVGIILSVLQSQAAIISGIVKDVMTQDPISNIYLNLRGSNKNTTSDNVGLFKFADIQPGTYTLIIRTIGDKKEAYQFPIATKYDSIFLKINLAVPNGIKLICSSETEVYRQKLKTDFPDIRDALDIQISKVLNIDDVDGEEGLYINLKMTNNSHVPVYLFKDYFCLRRLTPIIIDSNNDTLDYHYSLIDCNDQPVINYPSDLIEIDADSYIIIKKQLLSFYYHHQLLPGDYKVKVIYEFQFPNYIADTNESPETTQLIETGYCKIIRGNFESEWISWTKK